MMGIKIRRPMTNLFGCRSQMKATKVEYQLKLLLCMCTHQHDKTTALCFTNDNSRLEYQKSIK
jgi:hypothetical protein